MICCTQQGVAIFIPPPLGHKTHAHHTHATHSMAHALHTYCTHARAARFGGRSLSCSADWTTRMDDSECQGDSLAQTGGSRVRRAAAAHAAHATGAQHTLRRRERRRPWPCSRVRHRAPSRLPGATAPRAARTRVQCHLSATQGGAGVLEKKRDLCVE